MNNFSKKIYLNKTITRIKNKSIILNDSRNIYNFLNTRLIITLLLFFIFLFIPYGLVFSCIFSIGFYILDEYFSYDTRINKYKKTIEKQAINFLENLAVILQNNSNLDDSLKIVSDNINNDFSSLIKEYLYKISLGISKEEAYNELEIRIPSPNINNLLLGLKSYNNDSDSYNNIIKQLDFIRNDNQEKIKNKYFRVPVIVSLLSTIFIIATLCLIIIGPKVLSMI